MPSFCARLLMLLAILAAVAGLSAEAGAASDSMQPVPHEVAGSGSGSLDAILKRHKVPPEIRDAALRGFQLDPDFPTKLPKQSEFRLVYEEFPPVIEDAE